MPKFGEKRIFLLLTVLGSFKDILNFPKTTFEKKLNTKTFEALSEYIFDHPRGSNSQILIKNGPNIIVWPLLVAYNH